MSADTVVLDARLAHRGIDPERAYELLTPAERAKLDLLLGELGDIEASVSAAPLESNAEAHDVSDLLARASTTSKELESLRKARLRPLVVETESINALFRPVSDALASLVSAGKARIQAWREQERAREQREREAQAAAAARAAEALAAAEQQAMDATDERTRAIALAAAEAASQRVTAAVVAQPRKAATAFRSEHGTASGRVEWDFEVVDAAQVPRQYLEVNEKAIRAAVRAGGVREMPGVHIFERESIVTRTRR